MIRVLVYLSLFSLVFISCESPTKKVEQLKPKEVLHVNEMEFQVDTLLSDSSQLLSYGSKAIPNYYILAQKQTDSSLEAHIYADQSLFVIYKGDTININKDSLEKDINEAYLSEALLGGFSPLYFNTDQEEFVFQFYVKKPMEDFRYAFELFLKDEKWRVQILDE